MDHIQVKVLDDLYQRFIFSAPSREKKDVVRMMFRIELAHWFYLDNYCMSTHGLKPISFKHFTSLLFQRYPIFNRYNMIDAIECMHNYKRKIYVYGTLILNSSLDKFVMVQNIQSRTWTFPKGKVNQDESPIACAMRETLEETGVDVSEYIKPKLCIKISNPPHYKCSLFLAVGVAQFPYFTPSNSKEIRAVSWFDIDQVLHQIEYKFGSYQKYQWNVEKVLRKFCELRLNNSFGTNMCVGLTTHSNKKDLQATGKVIIWDLKDTALSNNGKQATLKTKDTAYMEYASKTNKYATTSARQSYNNNTLDNRKFPCMSYDLTPASSHLPFQQNITATKETNTYHRSEKLTHTFKSIFDSWKFTGPNPFILNI